MHRHLGGLPRGNSRAQADYPVIDTRRRKLRKHLMSVMSSRITDKRTLTRYNGRVCNKHPHVTRPPHAVALTGTIVPRLDHADAFFAYTKYEQKPSRDLQVILSAGSVSSIFAVTTASMAYRNQATFLRSRDDPSASMIALY
jgi:hypothetical protein